MRGRSPCLAMVALACFVLAAAVAWPASSARAASPTPVWGDEFSGLLGASPDPSKWQAVTGDWSGGDGELQYYTASTGNVRLDGAGHLVIMARHQRHLAADGTVYQYTSARLQTKDLFQTTYGRLAARIRVPAGQGLWPAFWALGSDIDTVDWPASGEIDTMENVGNDPFTIYGTIHGPQQGVPDGYALSMVKRSPVSLASAFHVYAVTWSPTQIVFSLDGTPYGTVTPASLQLGQQWAFDKPFYLLLNLAVGGDWPGSPDASTVFPAKLLVDWVRVYQ